MYFCGSLLWLPWKQPSMFRKRTNLYRGRVALLIYAEKSPLHGVQITNRNQGDAGIIPFYFTTTISGLSLLYNPETFYTILHIGTPWFRLVCFYTKHMLQYYLTAPLNHNFTKLRLRRKSSSLCVDNAFVKPSTNWSFDEILQTSGNLFATLSLIKW